MNTLLNRSKRPANAGNDWLREPHNTKLAEDIAIARDWRADATAELATGERRLAEIDRAMLDAEADASLRGATSYAAQELAQLRAERVLVETAISKLRHTVALADRAIERLEAERPRVEMEARAKWARRQEFAAALGKVRAALGPLVAANEAAKRLYCELAPELRNIAPVFLGGLPTNAAEIEQWTREAEQQMTGVTIPR